jgi:hypothetical protein
MSEDDFVAKYVAGWEDPKREREEAFRAIYGEVVEDLVASVRMDPDSPKWNEAEARLRGAPKGNELGLHCFYGFRLQPRCLSVLFASLALRHCRVPAQYRPQRYTAISP